MRNLLYYFTNPFDSDSISLAELVAFTTDHIERMTANNDSGDLDDRITVTSAALGGVS